MPVRPAVLLTLSYFAPGDTNVFAGPAEQHNVALAIEQGSMIPCLAVVKFFRGSSAIVDLRQMCERSQRFCRYNSCTAYHLASIEADSLLR
jgi:hypothetical protein